MGSFWDRFGDRFGIVLESFWDHFGIMLVLDLPLMQDLPFQMQCRFCVLNCNAGFAFQSAMQDLHVKIQCRIRLLKYNAGFAKKKTKHMQCRVCILKYNAGFAF